MAILFHANFVRISVHTANYVWLDWVEKTQGVWIQDFPRKAESQRGSPFFRLEKAFVTIRTFFLSLSFFLLSSSSFTNYFFFLNCTLGTSSEFEASLCDYLRQYKDRRTNIIALKIQEFDFSDAIVSLVPSIPGVHKTFMLQKYGHMRLR